MNFLWNEHWKYEQSNVNDRIWIVWEIFNLSFATMGTCAKRSANNNPKSHKGELFQSTYIIASTKIVKFNQCCSKRTILLIQNYNTFFLVCPSIWIDNFIILLLLLLLLLLCHNCCCLCWCPRSQSPTLIGFWVSAAVVSVLTSDVCSSLLSMLLCTWWAAVKFKMTWFTLRNTCVLNMYMPCWNTGPSYKYSSTCIHVYLHIYIFE